MSGAASEGERGAQGSVVGVRKGDVSKGGRVLKRHPRFLCHITQPLLPNSCQSLTRDVLLGPEDHLHGLHKLASEFLLLTLCDGRRGVG